MLLSPPLELLSTRSPAAQWCRFSSSKPMVRRRMSRRAQKAIHAEPHRGLPKSVCGESHLWAFPLKRSRSRGLDELPRGRHQEAKPVWTKPRSIVSIDWSKDPCSRVAARPFRSPSRKSRIASNAVGLHVNARSSTATSRSRSPRRACRRICRHGPHRRIALSPSRTASEASCLVAGSHHLEMVAHPATRIPTDRLWAFAYHAPPRAIPQKSSTSDHP